MTDEPTNEPANDDDPDTGVDDEPTNDDDLDTHVDDDPDPDAAGSDGRRRSIVALVLGVIAVTFLHAGVIGFWTANTVLDSDGFEDRVREVLQTEEVSGALASFIVEEVGASVDLRTPLVDIAPDGLEPLIDVLLAGVEARVEDQMARLIQSDEVAGSVAAAAGAAHGLAVDVLEGRSIADRLSVDDGRVRLNLVPLATRVLALLPDIGLFKDVEFPEFEPGGEPAEQVAELEAALGVDLADDFAQPVIFQSDTFDEVGETVDLARSVFQLVKQALWGLVLLGLLFGGLAIWLSRRRLRTGVLLAGGVVLYVVVTLLTTGAVADDVPEAVDEPGAQATIRQIVEGLERDLHRLLYLFAFVAIAAVGMAVVVARGGIRRAAPETATETVTETASEQTVEQPSDDQLVSHEG